jgi:hypothetical protein
VRTLSCQQTFGAAELGIAEVMTDKVTPYTKNCSGCGREQRYTRKDHYKSAVRGDWKCKSCSGHNNKFAGRIGPMAVTWYEVKRKAGLHRGYEWDLTPEYVVELYEQQEGLCALTGWPIEWSQKNLTATVSIDRIDSSEGYLQGNVQLLHKDVNMAKQQYSQEYFVQMCKAVASQSDY